MEDLVVDHRLTIPAGELRETFQTSGGPGGQHANRSATRVTLAWDVRSSSIDDRMRRRLVGSLGEQLTDGEMRVSVDESRSQWRNRRLARRRLAALVTEALRPDPAPRRPTRPSRRRRQERLDEKRRTSETKRLRQRPRIED